MSNEQQAIERCEYACEILRKENIPHKVCNKNIGHINLLGYVQGRKNLKPVMSFWSRTGRYIFLVHPKKLISNGDNRGLKNCILSYKDFIRIENEELEII